MTTPNSVFRFIADIVGSDGGTHTLDTDAQDKPLTLDGYRVDGVAKAVVAAVDTDVAINLGFDTVAVVVIADRPVSMRLGAGEILMTNGRFWCWVGDDAATVVFPSGTLIFDGNGEDDAIVTVIGVADAASVGTGLAPPSPPPPSGTAGVVPQFTAGGGLAETEWFVDGTGKDLKPRGGDATGRIGTPTERVGAVYAEQVTTGDLDMKREDENGDLVHYKFIEHKDGRIEVHDQVTGKRYRIPLILID